LCDEEEILHPVAVVGTREGLPRTVLRHRVRHVDNSDLGSVSGLLDRSVGSTTGLPLVKEHI
jgi:hypothetical protein